MLEHPKGRKGICFFNEILPHGTIQNGKPKLEVNNKWESTTKRFGYKQMGDLLCIALPSTVSNLVLSVGGQ